MKYRIVDIDRRFDTIQYVLNKYATDGWEFVQLIEDDKKLKAIFKKNQIKSHCFTDRQNETYCFETEKELNDFLKKTIKL